MTAYCYQHQQEEPCPVCEVDVHAPTAAVHAAHPSGIMTDREMWFAIRSGLLGILRALEAFEHPSALGMATRAALGRIISAIEKRWNFKRSRIKDSKVY